MASVIDGEFLISERLKYHKITLADLPDYISWYTNREVMKYVGNNGNPFTPEETTERFHDKLKVNEKHREIGWYSARLKDNDVYIGVVKMTYETEPLDSVEVGYGMLPEYWGKGYATEMLDCIMKHVKKLSHVKELTAVTHPDNFPSKKILLNQGFKLYDSTKDDEHYKLDLL